MANCRKCLFLSTLCLTHHWALGGSVRTLTASVNNDIGLDENCPLLRPVEKGEDVPVDIRFYKDEDYFPEWMNNQTLNETLLSGPVDVDPLNSEELSAQMFGETRGRQIWRKIKHETIVFIFMTDELMDRKNWTRQKLIGDHWLSEKSLGAVEGLFIFTPTEIVTISDCVNGFGGDPSFSRLKLQDVLESCGFQYNGCFCTEDGIPHDPIGHRCAPKECVGAITYDENYFCHECGVGYMGEHCKKSIFLFGTISITIISLTSLAGAVLAPLRSWKYYPDLQSGMIALAVGCLSGDAILHLIPIIFGLHGHAHAEKDHDDHDHDDHDHEEEHHDNGSENEPSLPQNVVNQRGMMLLMGLYIFYLFETSIGLYQHYREKRKEAMSPKRTSKSTNAANQSRHVSESCVSTLGHKLSVIDSHYDDNKPCFEENCSLDEEIFDDNENMPEGNRDNSTVLVNNENKITEQLIKGNGVKSGGKTGKKTSFQKMSKQSTFDAEGGHGHTHGHHSHGHSHIHGDIAMVGWMVIFGDALHNFADGLAIGAAFSASYSIGLGTVFAVFFHELPHEMGDFAVLLGSGMAVKQAMFWNLVSSFTCFVGFFVGVVLADSENIQVWILGIAAGAFVYIALVDMLPEMRLNSIHREESAFRRFIVHQIGLLTGVFIMWLMAVYEEDLVHFFQ